MTSAQFPASGDFCVCHRNADFCPYVRGRRIGPQGVRVLTAELLEMQAQHSSKITTMYVSNIKGKKLNTNRKFSLSLWFWVLLKRFLVENPKISLSCLVI